MAKRGLDARSRATARMSNARSSFDKKKALQRISFVGSVVLRFRQKNALAGQDLINGRGLGD